MDEQLQAQLQEMAGRVRRLEARIQAEEQRNQYLVAWLWSYANISISTGPALEAARLALACDPGLVWPPAPPAPLEEPQDPQ